MSEKFLAYEAVGIAKLLRTRALAVPFYQRSYSWRTATEGGAGDHGSEKLQVVEYWSDLQASFTNRDSYFLGTTVLARDGEEGRQLVIDGQQRLATTSLLLGAIRDEFYDRDEKDFGDSTQQDFLGKFDRRARADRPKLILNSDDRDYYERRIVQRDETMAPTNSSQSLIQEAFSYLRERVRAFAEQAGTGWRDRLNDLIGWLEDDVQVVAIEVASEADAFLIFETLNDRGADLTIADLLKNFLFSQSGPRLDEVRDSWISTLANLNIEKVGNQRFTDFARHLLSSRVGPTRERDVYQRIKSEVGTTADAVSFAQELKDSSRLYYAILSSDSEYWGDYAASVSDAAEVLVELNLEQYRPLMLAVLAKFDKSEIERFVPSLVSWVVRGLAVGSLGAGVAESAFSEAAREIRNGKITQTGGILNTRVGNLVPIDSEFQAAFASWRVMRGSLARYILRALELKERGESEPELVVNDDVDAVNLEHILPKNARLEDWPSFNEDEQRSYVHRIGNMALLRKGPNGRIGNKAWGVKKPVLSSSSLLITSAAGAESDWTMAVINQRQAKLAELAVQTWPRTPRS
ncbi:MULTISPECIES: DUF262 domain-containing protein [unclassified Microbacterium]|uniref:DUF262 domain-containing protein n=1 Tax=unclassified Microbacterium TaxID=2609290 RepID=UPI0028A81D5C|nr:DUF262 domain-containing protein [Microbacterium sp.]